MRDYLQAACDRARKLGAAYADARIVLSDYTGISRQDGKADRLSGGRSEGVGVRVLIDGAWGFASANATDKDSVARCLEEAVRAANAAETTLEFDLASSEPVTASTTTPCEIDPRSIPQREKMDVLRSHEAEMLRVAGEKAANTMVGVFDSVKRTAVCNTLGSCIESEETRVQMYCTVVTADGPVRQRGSESRAKLAGWEEIRAITPEEFSVEAAQRAVDLLSARKAPAGLFPVVLHPSVVGVFIHEAFGHNAEADLVLAGDSILDGKLGTQVASDLVSVCDDSTLPGMWGSFEYDHEGTAGRKRRIIDKGKLVGFMHSLESSGRMGVHPNGSARADGHAMRPIVRMSNTLVDAGETPVAEMIRGIELGVLFEKGQWGYVFCEKGQYTLSAGCGRMIRNGELAEMVRDVCMCGMVLETLHKVDAVSKEWEVSWGGGTCGKNGQSMPVSGGGPYMRVSEILVGGQEG